LSVWDELRRELGEDFSYGPGHWFCVEHEVVFQSSGRRFANKEGGSGRRVVLASAHGPNATIYPRSASIPTPTAHPAHVHDVTTGCRVDIDGWVELRVPVTVAASALDGTTYSCEEPAGSPLLADLDRASAP